MTAPALNPAQFLPTPASGAGAGAPAPGQAPRGAFDALMAALFPQTPVVVADTTPAAPTLPRNGDLLAEESTETLLPAEAGADADSASEDSEVAQGAETEVSELAADLAGAQTVSQPATTSPAPESAAAAPAWGQDKPKAVPAAPALQHSSPRADLAAKGSASADATEPAETPADVDAPVQAASPFLPPKAAAAARSAVQQAPPRALANVSTTPAADPALDAPTTAMVDADGPTSAAATPAASAGLETSTTASATARPEASAVAATPNQPVERDGKTEKKNAPSNAAVGASETPSGEAAQKSIAAKATEPAAKGSTAKGEDVELVAPESHAEADAPETVQPAEARATGQSAAPSAHTAAAVRGSPETVAALAAQIVKKIDGKSTRFDVELDPAGLGKVDVRVEIGAHGRMVASLTFENPQAAQDLKSRSGELQRALEQAGFDLSGGLSFDVAGDRGRQGQAWQEPGSDNAVFHGRAFRQALDNAGEADSAATQGALRLRRGVSAGLDLRI